MKGRYEYFCIIATLLTVFLSSQTANAEDYYYAPQDNDVYYVPPSYQPPVQQQPQQQTPAQPYYPRDNDTYYQPPQNTEQQIYLQQQIEIQRLREQQRLLEQRLREQEIQQREKESYPLYYY